MNPKIKVASKADAYAQKVIISAELSGVPYTVSVEDGKAVDTTTLPAVITTDGVELIGSSAGARYFARLRPDLGLYGFSVSDQSFVDANLSFFERSLEVPLEALSYMSMKDDGSGGSCQHKDSGSASCRVMADITKVLKSLETMLTAHTFISHERLSIADVSCFVALRALKDVRTDALNSYPAVCRWFDLIANQPAVKKVSATTTADVKSKGGKGKESAAKAPAAAAIKEKSAADIEDEIEAEAKAKAKAKNPLDSLPPSSMDLDQWKRVYSNTTELEAVAMKWFWENYDAAGWSLWHMKYDRYEGEGTVGFITSNMLKGFLQCIDPAARKVSFAVIDVVGTAGDFDIQGVWLLRGQEVIQELKAHRSFEYHTFRKLDLHKPEDKKLVVDYWCQDAGGSVEGRPIEDCHKWK